MLFVSSTVRSQSVYEYITSAFSFVSSGTLLLYLWPSIITQAADSGSVEVPLTDILEVPKKKV